jgi:serine phosphatase RsbU (regulator of sigma subunit)
VPVSRLSSTTRFAWVAAATLTVFAIWLITAGASNTGVGFFYAIPVGMAAWWWGWRIAAATVAGCLFLYIVGILVDPVPNPGLTTALRLVAWSAVAFFVGQVRERQIVLEHSAEELEDIRAALTPAALPELPGVEAAAAFVPSDHGVSGDFYLLTNGSDGSAVAIVGDVVGHGPEAARLATFVRARFAALAAGTSDPAELLMLTNRALVDRRETGSDLVSAVCLRYDGETSLLTWALAGHPPPVQLPHLRQLEGEGETFLLGAQADLVLVNSKAKIDRRDGVIAYTDGATDVIREGERLGFEGLAGLLTPLIREPAHVIARRIQEELLEWTDAAVADDLCVLVMRPRG